MRFDWYQATITAPHSVIVDAVMADLDGAHDVQDEDRGGAGYRATSVIRDRGGNTLARLLHGSSTAAPNLRGTSHNAVPVSEVIRNRWPDHAVSRLDVAEDMTSPGLFSTLQRTVSRIARAHGLESGLSFIPDTAERGSTYRVGAPTSATLVRLYQKDYERAAKGEIAIADADPDLCRLEIQCRPQKDAKRRFATIQPAEAWGSSKWTQHLASDVMAMDVERLYLRPREETDAERTMEHLAHQYLNFALDHGARLARANDGLVNPTSSEAIDAFTTALAQVMRRQLSARSGEHARDILDPSTHRETPAPPASVWRSVDRRGTAARSPLG